MILTVVTLSLLAALSPVLFLNSATLLTVEGRRPSVRFIAGAALVVLLLASAGAGLLGAGLSETISRAVSSRIVDGLLALLLLAYGLNQMKRVLRHQDNPDQPSAPRQGSAFGFGMLSMATNYTTLPLVLAAAQHVGSAGQSWWEGVGLIVLVVVITALPAWLPAALARIAPHLLTALRERLGKPKKPGFRIGAWIPVVACLIGSVMLGLHALGVWKTS